MEGCTLLIQYIRGLKYFIGNIYGEITHLESVVGKLNSEQKLDIKVFDYYTLKADNNKSHIHFYVYESDREQEQNIRDIIIGYIENDVRNITGQDVINEYQKEFKKYIYGRG